MKIGIISAIDKEVEILKKITGQYKEKKNNSHTVYISKIKKNDVFLIISGIGKVSASIATMLLIHVYKTDIIINIGSAGSLNTLLKIGDIIIPKETCYYDVDLTSFGYHLGQIPKYPHKFFINKKIFIFLKKIDIKNQFKFTTGLMISGDSFIQNNSLMKQLKNNFSSAIAVEMESTAIAQVCHKFKIPLIIIKYISDLSDKNATVNFTKNVSIASLQSSNFIKIIIENINMID